METRTQILVRGIVQGVGFRPYIYSLAQRSELRGKVFNNEHGVLIDVEGESKAIEQFVTEIQLRPPPLSIIESVESSILQKPAFFPDFRITESETNGNKFVPVSADIATCADCLTELFDPSNRRYRYPFINCTNCGPRFTIVEGVPYDRENTTMHEFEMCFECRGEYEDPTNRRFHAEPTCCSACGPTLKIREQPALAGDSDLIGQARQLLDGGKILAVKGIGGFHLVCDALNADAVETLRKRKYREDKPFALMANSVEIVGRYCFVARAERELLLSQERPIVLLERRPDAQMPQAIAPRMTTLGFMLPYTPLHYVLLEGLDGPLVMTSGNVSDEPIAYTDEDAGERLKDIADHCLIHDRKIHIRTDDSVTRVREDGNVIVLRRSRGYAPAPLKTSFKFAKQILGCGAELKNTFCISRDNYAFVSHHIGDLENLETLRSFTEGIEHYKKLFNLTPEVIAYDLHPEYLSTKYAQACEGIETKIGIQHHHAHIASCIADNHASGEVIGIAMDGLGFGTDGKLWGGEFFVADLTQAERIAHLDYLALAGGAKAIREPWRMAAAYLHRTFGEEFLELEIPFVKGLDRQKCMTIGSMILTKTNSPETSSMGRLFDAVSALLGIRSTVNYEGQAAIELEAAAGKGKSNRYEFELADGGIIKADPVIRTAVEDLLDGRSVREISSRFHMAVADLIVKVASSIRDERNLNRVALSGGVFQNMYLLENTCKLLRSQGFEVLTHSRVPTNDGGISFGQAVIANARIQKGSI